jgi:hypothetical protein
MYRVRAFGDPDLLVRVPVVVAPVERRRLGGGVAGVVILVRRVDLVVVLLVFERSGGDARAVGAADLDAGRRGAHRFDAVLDGLLLERPRARLGTVLAEHQRPARRALDQHAVVVEVADGPVGGDTLVALVDPLRLPEAQKGSLHRVVVAVPVRETAPAGDPGRRVPGPHAGHDRHRERQERGAVRQLRILGVGCPVGRAAVGDLGRHVHVVGDPAQQQRPRATG